MTRTILFNQTREVTETTAYGPLTKKVRVQVSQIEGSWGTNYEVNTYWNSQLVNGWWTGDKEQVEKIIAANAA